MSDTTVIPGAPVHAHVPQPGQRPHLLTAQEWQEMVLRDMARDSASAVQDRAALLAHVFALVKEVRALEQHLELEGGHLTETVSRSKVVKLAIPCACPD